jgi:hypothetical protein
LKDATLRPRSTTLRKSSEAVVVDILVTLLILDDIDIDIDIDVGIG